MRPKTAIALIAWRAAFVLCCALAVAIAVVCTYVSSVLWRKVAFIYSEVYGTVSYYGSDADRAELEPKLSHYVDTPLILLSAEVLAIYILLVSLLWKWRTSPWPHSHRRCYPMLLRPRDCEFGQTTKLSWFLTKVYVEWSTSICSYYNTTVNFCEKDWGADQIAKAIPDDRNYLLVYSGSEGALCRAFCTRPLSKEANVSAMQQYFYDHVVYGLDYQAPPGGARHALTLNTERHSLLVPIWREVKLWLGYRLSALSTVKSALEKCTGAGHLSRMACVDLSYHSPSEIVRLCSSTGAVIIPICELGQSHSCSKLFRANPLHGTPAAAEVILVGHPIHCGKGPLPDADVAAAAIQLSHSLALLKRQSCS